MRYVNATVWEMWPRLPEANTKLVQQSMVKVGPRAEFFERLVEVFIQRIRIRYRVKAREVRAYPVHVSNTSMQDVRIALMSSDKFPSRQEIVNLEQSICSLKTRPADARRALVKYISTRKRCMKVSQRGFSYG
jgi:hypothetical protein